MLWYEYFRRSNVVFEKCQCDFYYSYLDVAHVHIGALGWNGFLTFGMMYWLIPKLYSTQLYSKKLAATHFWIGTLGIILYAIPMYWSAFRSVFMMKRLSP